MKFFPIAVRYVDYGNLGQVNASQLRTLHNNFCELPCQALTVLAGEVSMNVQQSVLSDQSTECVGMIFDVRVIVYHGANVVEVEFLSQKSKKAINS